MSASSPALNLKFHYYQQLLQLILLNFSPFVKVILRMTVLTIFYLKSIWRYVIISQMKFSAGGKKKYSCEWIFHRLCKKLLKTILNDSSKRTYFRREERQLL